MIRLVLFLMLLVSCEKDCRGSQGQLVCVPQMDRSMLYKGHTFDLLITGCNNIGGGTFYCGMLKGGTVVIVSDLKDMRPYLNGANYMLEEVTYLGKKHFDMHSFRK